MLRFAPSPNGDLHLGHALSAITGYELACRLGGRFLVRVEDIDAGRARPDYVAGIFRDLKWLGIRWEEPVLRQSDRLAAYRAAAGKLSAMGLLYRCFATRSEIAQVVAEAGTPCAVDPDGVSIYPGLHRQLLPAEITRRQAAGQPNAMRLDMQVACAAAARLSQGQALDYVAFDADLQPRRVTAQPQRWGDAILQRKDVPTSYHLAVVVDDAYQGISHVTRGEDLLAATDLHRLLQVLLGLPAPIYHHHRLMTDATGRKLSKSLGDTSLRQLRQDGMTVDQIRRLTGFNSDAPG